jgi:hypothetical protein
MRKPLSEANEKKLARSLQKKKGKLPLTGRPSRVRVGGGDVIFSVRFSAEELEELRQRAGAQGIAISALIRKCVFSPSQTAQIDWTTVPFPMAVYSPSRFAMFLPKPSAKITVKGEFNEQWHAEAQTSSTPTSGQQETAD